MKYFDGRSNASGSSSSTILVELLVRRGVRGPDSGSKGSGTRGSEDGLPPIGDRHISFLPDEYYRARSRRSACCRPDAFSDDSFGPVGLVPPLGGGGGVPAELSTDVSRVGSRAVAAEVAQIRFKEFD